MSSESAPVLGGMLSGLSLDDVYVYVYHNLRQKQKNGMAGKKPGMLGQTWHDVSLIPGKP